MVSLYELAIHLLSIREHSELEMLTKLNAKRNPPKDELDELILKLINEDLLSNDRFCESFVYFKSQRGQGPNRIKMQLINRGIDDALINKYLYKNINYLNIAEKVWDKKFGETAFDYTQKAKQMRFLQYRGFDIETIRQIID